MLSVDGSTFHMLFDRQARAKRKAEEEAAYADAVVAMTAAKSRLSDSIPEDTAGSLVPLLNQSTMALLNKAPNKSPRQWATDVKKFVGELKIKNPSNTEFLTEVLNTAAEYINSIGTEKESDAFNKYETMRWQVETKFGRYTALSVALLGLPVSILVGGMIGTAALAIAFPPFMAGIVVAGAVLVIFGSIASTLPTNESIKIGMSWDSLKKDLGLARPSLGR